MRLQENNHLYLLLIYLLIWPMTPLFKGNLLLWLLTSLIFQNKDVFNRRLNDGSWLKPKLTFDTGKLHYLIDPNDWDIQKHDKPILIDVWEDQREIYFDWDLPLALSHILKWQSWPNPLIYAKLEVTEEICPWNSTNWREYLPQCFQQIQRKQPGTRLHTWPLTSSNWGMMDGAWATSRENDMTQLKRPNDATISTHDHDLLLTTTTIAINNIGPTNRDGLGHEASDHPGYGQCDY